MIESARRMCRAACLLAVFIVIATASHAGEFLANFDDLPVMPGLSVVKEAGIDVNKPDAATAVAKEKANILIAIDANGEIWIDRRIVDPRAVRANIERLHAENPQGTVVIQADDDARTGILVQVMDAARLAGVYDVAIAAAPTGD